jgi:hypothetical protein
MADELDDFTAAEIGHAVLRYLVDDDPANVGRFIPDLDPSTVDDEKAARIAYTLVDLLRKVSIA